METKEITLTAIIAALYAALVIILAPISYGPIQLRLADSLIPLSAIFGLPGIIGVSLGALIGNAYFISFTGFIDVFFGALANFIASYVVYRYKDRFIIATLFASTIIGIIVGGYLWIYFPPPPIGGFFLPAWLAMMISITISSFIAVTIIGVPLVKTLEVSKIFETLTK